MHFRALGYYEKKMSASNSLNEGFNSIKFLILSFVWYKKVIVQRGNLDGPMVSAGAQQYSYSVLLFFCCATKSRRRSTTKNGKSYTTHKCEPRPGRTPCQMSFSRLFFTTKILKKKLNETHTHNTTQYTHKIMMKNYNKKK